MALCSNSHARTVANTSKYSQMTRPVSYTDRSCSTIWCDYCGWPYSWHRHVSNACKICFFWLGQLRRARRSLDIESVKTLVHAFVTSRVDYCNSILSSAPKKVTDKLQHVQDAVARLVTETWKSVCVVCLGWCRPYDDLHWLLIPQRLQ